MVSSAGKGNGGFFARAIALVIALSASTMALAEADKNDATKGEHGGTSAPAAASTSPEGAQTSTTEVLPPEPSTERELGVGPYFSLSRFQFSAGWELHSMLVQNNLVGGGAETLFNYFYADGDYFLTKDDRFSVLMGLYQFALADPGESGWRTDDLVFRYRHHFALPWEVGLDVSGQLTAPTSFVSSKMGLVTEPVVRVGLDKTFGKYVTFDLRGFFAYYWQTYTTMQGGSSPNPTTRTGGSVSLSVVCPWHKPLSVGGDASTSYTTFYGPAGAPNSTPGIPSATGTVPYPGTENNPIYGTQPLQQDYGVDVYVRYDIPKRFYGVKAGVQLTYAQGEPTAGYTSEQIDGMSNLYLFYPESSEVFLSLDLKY